MNNSVEFLVIGRTNNKTKTTGSPYCTLKIQNLNTLKTVIVWDVDPKEPPVVGQLVKFYDSDLQNDEGRCSVRKDRMAVGELPSDSHPLYKLLPRPISRQLWQQTVDNLANMFDDSALQELFLDASQKLFDPYSKYPAATSIHHAYKGGLLNHTWQMLHMLEGLLPCLPYPVKSDYCALAALFHDYGKVYTYSYDGEQKSTNYLLGHIYLSANKLQRVLESHSIDDSVINKIVHIVLAHHGQKEYGSPVVPCSQEAVVVHMVDNLSAQVDTIERTSDMEYVSFLGTCVVK